MSKRNEICEVKPSERFFDKVCNKVTRITGTPLASGIAFLLIILWAVLGPVFHFSDTWQLVINTSTTIITFLMVFLIQQSQNKDTMAIQLKLNELIAASRGASNQLVDIEDMTETELETVKKFYVKLADKAEKENNIKQSHSLAELDKRPVKTRQELQRVSQQKTTKSRNKQQNGNAKVRS